MMLLTNAQVARKKNIVESVVELWGDCGKQNTIPVAGCSMLPLLKTGDQLQVLHRYNNAGVGDIIIFYKNNILVAHRIIYVKQTLDGPITTTKGDNAPMFDAPLDLHKIVGRVIAVERNGCSMMLDSPACKLIGRLIAAKTLVRRKLTGIRRTATPKSVVEWRYRILIPLLRGLQFTLKYFIEAIWPFAYRFTPLKGKVPCQLQFKH